MKTNHFGTILLYTDLTSSTMNTFSSLPNSIDNLIVVARQQNQGLGNDNINFVYKFCYKFIYIKETTKMNGYHLMVVVCLRFI